MRSNRRERLRQLREKIKAHREPLVIERVFRSAPQLGHGAPNASAMSAAHPTSDRAPVIDAGPQGGDAPASSAESMRTRCDVCQTVIDPTWRHCAGCGVRLEAQP